jgi:hypothetical protein
MDSDRESIIALGTALASELDDHDVLGRWMSHHLAELLTRWRAEPGDADLTTQIQDLVVSIWANKHGAPFRRRPHSFIEPALRAIARLDPDPDPFAFYRPLPGAAPDADSIARLPLLNALCDLDREVGDLIRAGVVAAARESTALEAPWVIAARAIAANEEDHAVRAIYRLLRTYTSSVKHDEDEVDGQGESSSSPEPDAASTIDPFDRAVQRAMERVRAVVNRLDELGAGSGASEAE